MMIQVNVKALEWIIGEDTGLSSKTIWSFMLGVGPVRGWDYPHDPDDLGRCLRLLRLMPEWKKRLPEMRSLSKTWAVLIDHWQEIEDSMIAEVGIDWEKARAAPITYGIMCRLMESVKT